MNTETFSQHQAESMAFESVEHHEPYAHHCDINPLSWRAAQEPIDMEDYADE